MDSRADAPSQYRPVTVNRKLYVPRWCYKDTPIPFESREGGFYVCDAPDADGAYNSYRNKRRESYFACKWYQRLKDNGIPVIDSQLISSSIHDLREDLKEAFGDFPEYRFVRLCGASPKDVVDPCVFATAKNASDAIMRSQRTLSIMRSHHCHLFLRRVVELENECRCIVHDRAVRAVSVYEWVPEKERAALEKSIYSFFDSYGATLPYNSCVVEIAWEKGGRDPGITEGKYEAPFVVEFNSFGIDGFAGASRFDWDSEYPLLYHASKPVFRYKGEFDW